MKRATRQCDKCLSEISKSNFNRHTAKCTGAGTWVQQEQQRKDSLQHSTHVCDVCGKILLTKSGLTGHKYRSHVNKDKAAAYGELGRTRKQEMIAAGHIFRGCVHTPETKEKLSLLMIDKLQKKPFWSKREIYNGVTLDSSYEVRVAKTDRKSVV